MTNTTTTTSTAAVGRLSPARVIGYGAGDMANNFAFSLAGSFLLYYYTDVAGLAAAAVGTLFLVVRLWDAFADMFAGRLVDRTKTRWGKFRPFLLIAGIPTLILSALSFNIPAGWGDPAKLLYAYLTYALLGLFYSLVNIPYGALASAMTQSVKERAKLVSARGIGASLGGLVIAYVISPQIAALQGQRETMSAEAYRAATQSIFTQITVILIVVGGLLYLFTFLTSRESVARVQDRVSFKETIQALKVNRPLAYLSASSFAFIVGMMATFAAMAYYAQYVLGDISLMGPIALIQTAAAFVVLPFIPKAVEYFGKKNLFQYSGLITVLGGILIAVTPQGAVVMALIAFGIMAIGQSIILSVMFALEADAVEYGEWKTGARAEGATYAVYSFVRKLSQAVGGWLGAMALTVGGYLSATDAVPDPVQPHSAILAIQLSQGLLPAACTIIGMLIFIKYPLTDKLFRSIRDETEARKRVIINEQN